MATTRRVTVIPVVETFSTLASDSNLKLKRVAAYARVSTDNVEKLSSYEAQVDNYTRYIQSNN